MLDEPPCLAFEVADQIFILHVEDRARRDMVPMRHQLAIGPAIAAKFRQVIAVDMAVGEQQREARKCSLAQITADVDDARLRKCEMNEAGEHAFYGWLSDEQPGQVVGTSA